MLDFEGNLRMGTTVKAITDCHSIHTNPEISLKLTARCGRFTAVCRGHKTQTLQMLDQFLSESMPAMFLATLGINLLLWLCC